MNTSSIGAIMGADRANRAGTEAGLQIAPPEVINRMVELSQEIQATTDRVYNLIERINVVSRIPSPETSEKEAQPSTNCELGVNILEQQLKVRQLRRVVDDALARLEI